MIDLHLRRTPASGDLLPVRLTPLLLRWSEPRAKLKGQELRLALSLSLDDDACAGFVLDFAGQGARIEATVQGASAPLLVWAFHALATATKCEVVAPTPPPTLAEARAYLEVYEADVTAMRKAGAELDGAAFVDWLVREELVVLDGRGDFGELPVEDAAETYERLLEHPAVADVFVSERELARLMTRFLARGGTD